MTTPPATMAAASQASSPSGTPAASNAPEDLDAKRQAAAMCANSARASITMAERLAQDRNAGAGLDGLRREMPAEGARAGHGVEQAEHVARDGMQPRAARELALDIGDEALRSRPCARRERRGLAEHQRIDREQPPRLLIGGAAHHHAVDVLEMRRAPASTLAMPPLIDDRQLRMRAP